MLWGNNSVCEFVVSVGSSRTISVYARAFLIRSEANCTSAYLEVRIFRFYGVKFAIPFGFIRNDLLYSLNLLGIIVSDSWPIFYHWARRACLKVVFKIVNENEKQIRYFFKKNPGNLKCPLKSEQFCVEFCFVLTAILSSL